MRKRPSLKDIAKKLKVSPTTVSFVLNGKGKEKKISDEVIKKILTYTRDINFKPNQVAQSLRTGKTNILVFMVEDISNYFFAKIARIIEDLAYERGYRVLFCSNENDDQRSAELIYMFYERQVDGFIIIPSPGIKNEIEFLMKSGVPVVLFDRYFDDLDTNYVIIDNEYAGYKATQHLIENGFKRIGFITTDSEQNQMLNRLQGYNNAMEAAGLVPNIQKIPFEKIQSEDSKELVRNFILKDKLDSIFFSTNYLTQTGLEIIKNENPDLLHKMGIVTFDDNDLFRIYTPSITAVNQPLEQIGEKLMEIMLDLLDAGKDNPSSQKVVLNTELIVRESSKDRKVLKN